MESENEFDPPRYSAPDRPVCRWCEGELQAGEPEDRPCHSCSAFHANVARAVDHQNNPLSDVLREALATLK